MSGARTSARLAISEDGPAVIATIRPQKDFFVIFVAAVLCAFCAMALAFGGRGLIERWPDWFLLGLLLLFALGLIAGTLMIVLISFGREVIRADEDKLTVRTELLFFKWSAEYKFSEITGLEAQPEPDSNQPYTQKRERGRGPIVISHRGETLRIGAGLSQDQALYLTKLLKWETCGKLPETMREICKS